MRAARSLIVIATALGAGVAAPASAIQPAGAVDGLAIVGVDTSAYPDVRLVVEVPDALADATLEAGNVTVSEAGADRPVTLTPVLNDQLRAVLVVDTSGSMRGASMQAAQHAAAAFLDRLPPGADAAVVGFGTRPVIVHGASTDRAAAAAAIRSLTANGETALHDAVVVAAQQAGADGRRTEIVLLSDGGDTVSSASLDRAVEVLTASGARLHAVALDSAEANVAALERLAGAARGAVVRASDGAALAVAYERLARRFVHQYELAFASAAHGATEVTVDVRHAQVSASTTATLDLPAAAATAVAESPTRARSPMGMPPAVLVTGGLAFFLGVSWLLVILFVPAAPRALIAGSARRLRNGTRSSALSGISERATLLAESVIDGQRSGRLSQALEAAGMALRPAELVVIVASGALTALLFGFIVGAPILGIALALAVPLAAKVYVGNRTAKRCRRFGDQLADTLQQLTGAMRAGNGLLQALGVVAREADEPTAGEFQRLMTEVRLGRDLSEALRAMATRVRTEDFNWAVQAVDVQRDVGGDLVEVLETVAATIRERHRLQRQVKALSAEGRFSAYILLALPFAIGGVMFLLNRPYILRLFTEPRGLVLLGFGAVLMGAGTVWLKALIRTDF